MYEYVSRQTYLERPRLVQKLNQATSHRLTVVAAAPGYGKTTAVSQYAETASHPIAWHTVEPYERDLTNLSNHSITILEAVCPGISKLKPTGTPIEMAATIANYLADRLREDVVYILDDVQVLDNSPAASRWMRTFLEYAPRRCHVMLVGRSLPNIPLHDLLTRQELLHIEQGDLRFSKEEVRDLAALYCVPFNDEQIGQLHRQLEGWAAGTLLHFQSLNTSLASYRGLSGEVLFQSLAKSMLAAQSEDMRSFLLKSATLRVVSPDVCQAVFGITNAAHYLDELQRRNLFVFREKRGVVFHSLLRTFLQNQLRADDLGSFRQYHGAAALYFDQSGASDDAFDHYLAAGFVDKAANLAERTATAYFIEGRSDTLIDWADCLKKVNVLSPTLSSCCINIDLVQFQFERAIERLNILDSFYRQRQDNENLINLRLQWAALHLQQGRYPEAAEDMVELLAEVGPTHRATARILYILGNARLHLSDLKSAAACFEEALAMERGHTDAYSLSQILQSLGQVYSRLGDLSKACVCLLEGIALLRDQGRPSALALALNNLGFYYFMDGDYDLALNTLEDGLQVLARYPESRSEAYLLSSLADLKRDLGLFDEAQQHYERGLEVLGEAEPFLRCTLLIGLATMFRWQGRLEDALQAATLAVAIAEPYPTQVERILALASLWAVRARTEDATSALTELEVLRATLNQQDAPVEWARLLGLSAEAALLDEKSSQAMSLLRTAETLSRPAGVLQPLSAEIVGSSVLTEYVKRNSQRLSVLQKAVNLLLEARNRTATDPAISQHASRRLPYHVHIHTLGHMHVERDGEPVPTSAWRSANARELFLYLVFVGPSIREQISLLLWPDSSTAQTRSNFHTVLYHTRLSLGADTILVQDGLYLINPALDIWCDAWEFERLAAQARSLSQRDAQREDRWRRAVALYRGEFLPDLDRDWVTPYREKLAELFLESLIGLGECQRLRRDYPSAIENFRRALAVDPLREETHRSLLRCYGERGDKQQVVSHMRDLEVILRKELGIKPSHETRQLVLGLLT